MEAGAEGKLDMDELGLPVSLLLLELGTDQTLLTGAKT